MPLGYYSFLSIEQMNIYLQQRERERELWGGKTTKNIGSGESPIEPTDSVQFQSLSYRRLDWSTLNNVLVEKEFQVGLQQQINNKVWK